MTEFVALMCGFIVMGGLSEIANWILLDWKVNLFLKYGKWVKCVVYLLLHDLPMMLLLTFQLGLPLVSLLIPLITLFTTYLKHQDNGPLTPNEFEKNLSLYTGRYLCILSILGASAVAMLMLN